MEFSGKGLRPGWYVIGGGMFVTPDSWVFFTTTFVAVMVPPAPKGAGAIPGGIESSAAVCCSQWCFLGTLLVRPGEK